MSYLNDLKNAVKTNGKDLVTVATNLATDVTAVAKSAYNDTNLDPVGSIASKVKSGAIAQSALSKLANMPLVLRKANSLAPIPLFAKDCSASSIILAKSNEKDLEALSVAVENALATGREVHIFQDVDSPLVIEGENVHLWSDPEALITEHTGNCEFTIKSPGVDFEDSKPKLIVLDFSGFLPHYVQGLIPMIGAWSAFMRSPNTAVLVIFEGEIVPALRYQGKFYADYFLEDGQLTKPNGKTINLW